ncbi:hypothetical protein JCM8097_005457 [Rhodosporidiobolus ruineniae]
MIEHRDGAHSTKAPFPSLPSLLHRRRLLWEAAIAPSTSVAYERAFRSWSTFAATLSLPAFPSPHSLSLFVTYRADRVVPTTLAGELSGLAFYFKTVDADRWEKARSSTEVVRVLLGNHKLNPHTPVKAVPLGIDTLVAGVELSLRRGTYDGLVFATMSVVCFFSCARAQELTSYDNPSYADSRKLVLRSPTRWTEKGFSADLPYHKADPLYSGSKLYFSHSDAGDLARVVEAFLAARDKLFGRSGPLWLVGDGTSPPRSWFAERVKARMGGDFTGHTFRVGGASFYALSGMKEDKIKRIGRWKSAGWQEYVRLQPEVASRSASGTQDKHRRSQCPRSPPPHLTPSSPSSPNPPPPRPPPLLSHICQLNSQYPYPLLILVHSAVAASGLPRRQS